MWAWSVKPGRFSETRLDQIPSFIKRLLLGVNSPKMSTCNIVVRNHMMGWDSQKVNLAPPRHYTLEKIAYLLFEHSSRIDI